MKKSIIVYFLYKTHPLNVLRISMACFFPVSFAFSFDGKNCTSYTVDLPRIGAQVRANFLKLEFVGQYTCGLYQSCHFKVYSLADFVHNDQLLGKDDLEFALIFYVPLPYILNLTDSCPFSKEP